MSWIIALAAILIVLVVSVLFIVAMPKFKIMQQLIDKLNLVTREILTGLSVIRAFSTEKHEEERFDKAKRFDKNQSFCKPCYDIYDAGYDGSYECNFCTDRMDGSAWHK